jgi:hypothetical protein
MIFYPPFLRSSRRPGEGCHTIKDFITFLSFLPQAVAGKEGKEDKKSFFLLLSILPQAVAGKVTFWTLLGRFLDAFRTLLGSIF